MDNKRVAEWFNTLKMNHLRHGKGAVIVRLDQEDFPNLVVTDKYTIKKINKGWLKRVKFAAKASLMMDAKDYFHNVPTRSNQVAFTCKHAGYDVGGLMVTTQWGKGVTHTVTAAEHAEQYEGFPVGRYGRRVNLYDPDIKDVKFA